MNALNLAINKMMFLSKIQQLFNLQIQYNPSQNTKSIFYKTRANNPNICTEPQKTVHSQSNPEKEKQSLSITIPEYKLYYKGILIKTYGTGTKADI